MQNKEKIERIKRRLFKKEKEYNIIDVWHYLMIHYGYIPFEEFMNIDAFLVNELVDKLNEMNENNSGTIGSGRLNRRRI